MATHGRLTLELLKIMVQLCESNLASFFNLLEILIIFHLPFLVTTLSLPIVTITWPLRYLKVV